MPAAKPPHLHLFFQEATDGGPAVRVGPFEHIELTPHIAADGHLVARYLRPTAKHAYSRYVTVGRLQGYGMFRRVRVE